MDIQTTNLSKRLRGALSRSGIKTYEALSEKTATDLIDTPGFGKKTLLEATKLLADAGYSLTVPIEPTPTDELTKDERTVLSLRSNGISHLKIAAKLDLSSTRIIQIERSAMRKAGIRLGIKEAYE